MDDISQGGGEGDGGLKHLCPLEDRKKDFHTENWFWIYLFIINQPMLS